MPLGAEPFSAALDLVLDFVASSFTRASIVALLRSPHFLLGDGGAIDRKSVSSLDRALSEARYLGEFDSLVHLVTTWRSDPARVDALPALMAAAKAAEQLLPLRQPAPTSTQIECLLSFIGAHDADDGKESSGRTFDAREKRVRQAIFATLRALATASRAYGDAAVDAEGLTAIVRRAIEDQTFDSRADAPQAGVQLLDDQAARYGDFDDVTIVGVIEADWPERPRRNIFYPPALLNALAGRPKRIAAPPPKRGSSICWRPRPGECTSRPSRSTKTRSWSRRCSSTRSRGRMLSTDRARRLRLQVASSSTRRCRSIRSRSGHARAEKRSDGPNCGWPASAPTMLAFHGRTRAGLGEGLVGQRARDVSRLPVQVLRAARAEARGRAGRRRGDGSAAPGSVRPRACSSVLQTLAGQRRSSDHAGQSRAARACSPTSWRRASSACQTTEAALERTRLLGSSAAAGLGEAVLRMEAERPVAVVDRLLEHSLRGDFTFQTATGPRTIALRGKADRLDLLADGTFRLIDYKLGWPPNRTRALQLPIYSPCAEQRLARHRGRNWTLGEAAYLAFKGPRRVVPLFSAADRDRVLREAQQRLADTVDAIERGEFPPRPTTSIAARPAVRGGVPEGLRR